MARKLRTTSRSPARTGDLSIGGDGSSAKLPVRAGEREVVRSFLATCRAA